MKFKIPILLVGCLVFGCIGTDIEDDIVSEKLEITNPIMSLKVGDTYDLMYRYLNHVAAIEAAEVRWETSNPSAITIDDQGVITAVAMGDTQITVYLKDNDQIMANLLVSADTETVLAPSDPKSGTIATTSSYQLRGDFTIENIAGGVEIKLGSNYAASSDLPGLYVYLSNNPNTVSQALQVSAVTVFSGAHSYKVTGENLNTDTYAYLLYFCKPFNVKVGVGEILD
ncbi:Ig-like domain-containing protein [Reichenbachiella carrageenanivorans]|uniref:Ig-like domain-containing protein n=1 Tax=Reichenbachiella carrageenanivorans TaxID=2979869 RepID=A0ABY6D013_9BACT|nr:Ig-like domain-containing protein [Reichenbachiella carrageenanivorans]UXX78975.1 Ig-like domain-containing protein [Reichenbachiella carrageenanivorans]